MIKFNHKLVALHTECHELTVFRENFQSNSDNVENKFHHFCSVII